jgi:hypothetical protein
MTVRVLPQPSCDEFEVLLESLHSGLLWQPLPHSNDSAKVGKDAGQNVVRSDQDDNAVGLDTDHAAETPDDVERQITAHPPG